MAHKYLVDDDFEFVSIYSGQNNKDEKFIDSLATQARSEIQFCENDIQDGFTKEFLDIFSFKEPKQQIIDTLGNNLNEDPEPEFSIAEMKKIAKKITEQQMQTIEDELDEDEQCDQYVEQKDQFNQPNTIHSQPKQSLSHKQNKMSLTEELALMRANISKDIDDEYAEVERLRLEAEEKQRWVEQKERTLLLKEDQQSRIIDRDTILRTIDDGMIQQLRKRIKDYSEEISATLSVEQDIIKQPFNIEQQQLLQITERIIFKMKKIGNNRSDPNQSQLYTNSQSQPSYSSQQSNSLNQLLPRLQSLSPLRVRFYSSLQTQPLMLQKKQQSQFGQQTSLQSQTSYPILQPKSSSKANRHSPVIITKQNVTQGKEGIQPQFIQQNQRNNSPYQQSPSIFTKPQQSSFASSEQSSNSLSSLLPQYPFSVSFIPLSVPLPYTSPIASMQQQSIFNLDRVINLYEQQQLMPKLQRFSLIGQNIILFLGQNKDNENQQGNNSITGQDTQQQNNKKQNESKIEKNKGNKIVLMGSDKQINKGIINSTSKPKSYAASQFTSSSSTSSISQPALQSQSQSSQQTFQNIVNEYENLRKLRDEMIQKFREETRKLDEQFSNDDIVEYENMMSNKIELNNQDLQSLHNNKLQLPLSSHNSFDNSLQYSSSFTSQHSQQQSLFSIEQTSKEFVSQLLQSFLTQLSEKRKIDLKDGQQRRIIKKKLKREEEERKKKEEEAKALRIKKEKEEREIYLIQLIRHYYNALRIGSWWKKALSGEWQRKVKQRKRRIEEEEEMKRKKKEEEKEREKKRLREKIRNEFDLGVLIGKGGRKNENDEEMKKFLEGKKDLNELMCFIGEYEGEGNTDEQMKGYDEYSPLWRDMIEEVEKEKEKGKERKNNKQRQNQIQRELELEKEKIIEEQRLRDIEREKEWMRDKEKQKNKKKNKKMIITDEDPAASASSGSMIRNEEDEWRMQQLRNIMKDKQSQMNENRNVKICWDFDEKQKENMECYEKQNNGDEQRSNSNEKKSMQDKVVQKLIQEKRKNIDKLNRQGHNQLNSNNKRNISTPPSTSNEDKIESSYDNKINEVRKNKIRSQSPKIQEMKDNKLNKYNNENDDFISKNSQSYNEMKGYRRRIKNDENQKIEEQQEYENDIQYDNQNEKKKRNVNDILEQTHAKDNDRISRGALLPPLPSSLTSPSHQMLSSYQSSPSIQSPSLTQTQINSQLQQIHTQSPNYHNNTLTQGQQNQRILLSTPPKQYLLQQPKHLPQLNVSISKINSRPQPRFNPSSPHSNLNSSIHTQEINDYMETTLHSQRSAEQIEIMSIDSTSNQQRIQRNNRSFSNTQLSSSSRRQPIVKGKPKEKSARDSLLDQFTTVPTNAMEAYQNGGKRRK